MKITKLCSCDFVRLLLSNILLCTIIIIILILMLKIVYNTSKPHVSANNVTWFLLVKKTGGYQLLKNHLFLRILSYVYPYKYAG